MTDRMRHLPCGQAVNSNMPQPLGETHRGVPKHSMTPGKAPVRQISEIVPVHGLCVRELTQFVRYGPGGGLMHQTCPVISQLSAGSCPPPLFITFPPLSNGS